MPTSTVSGTANATARSMRSRTNPATVSASAAGTSNSSSSCTVRIMAAPAGSSPWMSIIARLRMSAAVPWIGRLTVTRSAAARICPLRLVSSGTARRRPNIVLT